MGDIAQILGVSSTTNNISSSSTNDPFIIPSLLHSNSTTTSKVPRAVKLQQLPKEVLDLVGGSSSSRNNHSNNNNSNLDYVDLPPAVPGTKFGRNVGNNINDTTTTTTTTTGNNNSNNPDIVVKVGNKWISSMKPARSWIYAPFTNTTARNDGLILYHWVRNHIEYVDYPYARFNIHLDTVSYNNNNNNNNNNKKHDNHNNNNDNTNSNSNNEYYTLQLDQLDPTWSKSETDFLLELVQRYELRWPIIYDRFIEVYNNNNNNNNNTTTTTTTRYQRNIEDIQYRYYTVAARINQSRITMEAEIEAHSLSVQLNTAMNTSATSSSSSATVTSGAHTNPTSTAAAATATTTTIGDVAGTSTPAMAATAVPGTTSATNVTSSTSIEEENIKKQRVVEALLIETAAARSLATMEPQYQPLIHNIGTGTTNKMNIPIMDLQKERERRSYMDALWNRSKEEEIEELELRKELKQIELQLRKLKKSGVHIAAAANTASTSTTTTVGTTTATAGVASTVTVTSGMNNSNTSSNAIPSISQNPSRTATPIQFGSSTDNPIPSVGHNQGAIAVDPSTLPAALDHIFTNSSRSLSNSSGPIAVPGIPYLQSCRLLPPGVGDGATINAALLSRMDKVLDELQIPQNPIPTKRVCDLYDNLRKDILTLLILQKDVLQKEGILATKHLKLARKSGNTRVNDEETLLGIPPPPPPIRPPTSTTPATSNTTTTTTAASATATSGKGSRSTKNRTSNDGTTTSSKKKSGSSKAVVGDSKEDSTTTMKGKSGTGEAGLSSSGGGGKQPRKPSVPGANKRKRKTADEKVNTATSAAAVVVSGSVPQASTSIVSSVPSLSTSTSIHPDATVKPPTAHTSMDTASTMNTGTIEVLTNVATTTSLTTNAPTLAATSTAGPISSGTSDTSGKAPAKKRPKKSINPETKS